ncbi:MAG: hypothetical protein ACTHJ0_01280 [Flavipsychrobacter sp.]
MKKYLFILLLAIYFIPIQSTGQSIPKIKTTISGYLDRIEYWGQHFDKDDADSLSKLNEGLLLYMKKVCKSNPATIKANFKDLDKKGLNVVSSEDGKLRIYCWYNNNAGTMRSYSSIAQYLNNGKVNIEVLNDAQKNDDPYQNIGYFFSDLRTIKTLDKKTVYLVETISILATLLYDQSVGTFIIDNGKLRQDYPFFKTKVKTIDQISFEVDWSKPNRYNAKDEDGKIKISTDNKTLSIPIINSFSPTGKFLTYKFNGYKFVNDKNAKG